MWTDYVDDDGTFDSQLIKELEAIDADITVLKRVPWTDVALERFSSAVEAFRRREARGKRSA